MKHDDSRPDALSFLGDHIGRAVDAAWSTRGPSDARHAAPGSLALSLASTKQVYRIEQCERELGRVPENNLLLKRTLEKLIEREGERFSIRPGSLAALDPVYEECPNFKPVLDEIRKFIALALTASEPLSFTPIMLAGDPGIGKTHFAKVLARALGTGFDFLALSAATANFMMTGASPGWSGGRHGKVSNLIVDGDVSNPVMVIDEIDKARGDSRYDVMGSFYQLLEPETAQHFKDEFLGDVEFDVSGYLWIATANDLSGIPEPILNRMDVFEVRSPTVEEARRIATRIYDGLTRSHPWGISGPLSEDVLAGLERIPPREMRRAMVRACGSACADGRGALEPKDFPRPSSDRPRMGFAT